MTYRLSSKIHNLLFRTISSICYNKYFLKCDMNKEWRHHWLLLPNFFWLPRGFLLPLGVVDSHKWGNGASWFLPFWHIMVQTALSATGLCLFLTHNPWKWRYSANHKIFNRSEEACLLIIPFPKTLLSQVGTDPDWPISPSQVRESHDCWFDFFM